MLITFIQLLRDYNTMAKRLQDLVDAADLRRNVIIHDNSDFVDGEWIAIPKEDFDALRSALRSLGT